MARVSGLWKKVGDSIETAFPGGVDLLIKGLDRYINFGFDQGPSGYGLRDNGGTLQFKDSSGAWSNFGSLVPTSFETVANNLDPSGAILTYTGDDLTTVTYVDGVIKTFNYTGDNLTSVVLSGNTPGGIDLTKTFTYLGDELTGVSYS